MLFVTNILIFLVLIISLAGVMRPRGAVIFGLAVGIISLLNLLITRFAWVRLKNALLLRKEVAPMPPVIRELPSLEPAALPAPSAGFSITEGTTELLGAQRREEVPVPRDKRDTDSIN
jgi:hypothetical protein